MTGGAAAAGKEEGWRDVVRGLKRAVSSWSSPTDRTTRSSYSEPRPTSRPSSASLACAETAEWIARRGRWYTTVGGLARSLVDVHGPPPPAPPAQAALLCAVLAVRQHAVALVEEDPAVCRSRGKRVCDEPSATERGGMREEWTRERREGALSARRANDGVQLVPRWSSDQPSLGSQSQPPVGWMPSSAPILQARRRGRGASAGLSCPAAGEKERRRTRCPAQRSSRPSSQPPCPPTDSSSTPLRQPRAYPTAASPTR